MLTGRRCGGTRRDILPIEQDAALVRRLEAGEQAQQRGLAAARRTEQREELALENVERELLDRGHAAKALADASKRTSACAAGCTHGAKARRVPRRC